MMRADPFIPATGGNGNKAYLCLNCNLAITYSDRLLAVSGSKRHSYVNPAELTCEFLTFSSCPGGMTLGLPTEQYSWFSGYSWCLAVCGNCHNHLGWHYRRLSESEGPTEFWGILINQIRSFPL